VITTMTSREFNQRTSRAKKAAAAGPVVVTDRGRPDRVLLTYDAYLALAGVRKSLADAFTAMPDAGAVDVDFPRSRDLPRPVVFD